MKTNLGFWVDFCASFDIFWADSSFGQIDVSLVFVHPDDDDRLFEADADQFVDGPDTTTGQLGEQDHAYEKETKILLVKCI